MANKVKVEVVTPVHNRREETLLCLRSLFRSDLPGIDLHVIIVDDGSTDGTADAVRASFPAVQIVEGSGDLWFTAGTNRGIVAALERDPDYILAINNDQVFDANCIAKMVDCAERHPRSVVGALLLLWDVPHRVFQVAPRWELLRGGYRHWYRQTVWSMPQIPFEVELIVGNCVLYPAQAVRDCGLMDEKHLVQYGDAEYTPRMRRAGWRLLIEPRARVFCKPNDNAEGFRSLSFRKKLKRLFSDPAGPYSLKRRWYANIGGAPNKVEGILAIPIWALRLLAGRNQEGRWGVAQPEPDLKELFADKVVGTEREG